MGSSTQCVAHSKCSVLAVLIFQVVYFSLYQLFFHLLCDYMTDISSSLGHKPYEARVLSCFCSFLFPGSLVESLNKYVERAKCGIPFCGEWGGILRVSQVLSWSLKNEQPSVKEQWWQKQRSEVLGPQIIVSEDVNLIKLESMSCILASQYCS